MSNLITDYLDEAVNNEPNKIAFIDNERKISFRNLRREAIIIASHITRIKKAICPIALFMKDEISCISAFMGVLYSNNYYTVIETNLPEKRILQIIDDFRPEMLITTKSDESRIREITKDFEISVLVFEDVINTDNYDESCLSILPKAFGTDLACVAYTSGSTGKPKGAIMTHIALIDALKNEAELCGFSEKTVFANHCPFCFVGSVTDIYGTIYNRATAYIIPRGLFMNPDGLADFLFTNRINSMVMTVSAMQMVERLDVFSLRSMSEMSVIYCGAGALPIEIANYFIDHLPNAAIYYVYASSEVLFRFWKKIRRQKTGRMAVGIPFPGTEAVIIDNEQEVEDGVPGELYIRGINGPIGYYGDFELTDNVLVKNPVNPYYTEYLYKTGDLAIRNKDGEIEILGRIDSQIKHRGFRISLQEIETCVNGCVNVRECCCIYDNKINLYYSGIAEEKEVIEYIKERLPEYMIPGSIWRLSELPHNANGKVDRMELKQRLQKETEK